MGLLVDETSRSDGFRFGDGPLEQSSPPIGGGALRVITLVVYALLFAGVAAWIWCR